MSWNRVCSGSLSTSVLVKLPREGAVSGDQAKRAFNSLPGRHKASYVFLFGFSSSLWNKSFSLLFCCAFVTLTLGGWGAESSLPTPPGRSRGWGRFLALWLGHQNHSCMEVTHPHFREPCRAPAVSLNLFSVGPSFPAPHPTPSAPATSFLAHRQPGCVVLSLISTK